MIKIFANSTNQCFLFKLCQSDFYHRVTLRIVYNAKKTHNAYNYFQRCFQNPTETGLLNTAHSFFFLFNFFFKSCISSRKKKKNPRQKIKPTQTPKPTSKALCRAVPWYPNQHHWSAASPGITENISNTVQSHQGFLKSYTNTP